MTQIKLQVIIYVIIVMGVVSSAAIFLVVKLINSICKKSKGELTDGQSESSRPESENDCTAGKSNKDDVNELPQYIFGEYIREQTERVIRKIYNLCRKGNVRHENSEKKCRIERDIPRGNRQLNRGEIAVMSKGYKKRDLISVTAIPPSEIGDCPCYGCGKDAIVWVEIVFDSFALCLEHAGMLKEEVGDALASVKLVEDNKNV